MSRVAKWKIEKAKVKVVFRLQFHATHIPQSGWEKLFISFVPTETGKATAKTSKANVRGGSCKWADPIYETTRLLLDSKTKQYDDKLYKLVVGMGTSRSSILGEATINLADYADASQPSVLSLPLHGSDHGTILHVTVQLLTAKTGFREFEQQRDKGLQSGNNVNKETELSTAKSPSSELQIPDDLVNKAKTRIQLREETSIHGEYSDSQVTCDESSTASDNYYADKHDSPPEKLSGSDQAKLDNDMAVVYEENNRLKATLAAAESSISELKQELTALQSHANEMGTETQKLAQELTVEIASSQELVKEVNLLKSECSKFQNDLQNLKDIKPSSKIMERKVNKTEHDTEVNGVLLVEAQIQEIQEKILTGFRESDFSHLQVDFEVLLGTVQHLKNETFGEVKVQPFQELEIAKAEKENLVKKMDEMECYYESLVQELEENQKRILGECQNLKNEMNDLSSVNHELQKRVTVSESALKRARLNYSIAVSQLQKDLDMLSFQVLSMFETNQTVIKEAFAETTQPSSKHLSDDLKKSLSIQENLYKKVEELGEMCSANLQFYVYSGTLEETLFEASDHIRKMNEKLQQLGKDLQFSNQSRDSLFQENGYYLAKCNDLQLQNRMWESDLGNLSNENFLLMEKITECEALLMEYRVYKGKYEAISDEKVEIEKHLEAEVSDKQNLEKEIKILRSDMDDVKMKYVNALHQTVLKMDVKKPSFEKLQLQIDSVVNMFQSSLESGERHAQNSEVMLKNLSLLELELQNISSDGKSFHEQIIYELKKENQDLMVSVENKRGELDRLQEYLDAERGTVACLTSELESQSSELESCKLKLDASIAQNAEITKSSHLLETSLSNVNNEHDLKVRQLKEMLTKSKAEVEKFKELQMKLEDAESRLNGCLKNEAFYIEENRNLAMELESLRLELQASVAKSSEILESKNEHALEAIQLKDMLTTSKEEVARYIKENRKLVTQIESLRLELQASIAEITEAKTMHALEASQLKEMLTKSKDEVARYIEENRNLETEIEYLRSDLEASVAKNAEVAESENEHAQKVGQLKEMLTKSNEEVAQYIEENKKLVTEIESLRSDLQDSVAINDEISESKTMHALEASQLKEMLTKSTEEVARYIEENRNLGMEIESLKSELQASIAKNAKVAESDNEHALKVGQLNEMLTKLKEEVVCYTEENRNFAMEMESLKLELQASVAKNAEFAESKKEHDSKVGQLKEMLMKSNDEVAHYIEENKDLATKVESLRAELQASVAKSDKIPESKTMHALEASQLKEMLTKSKDEVACYIEENKSLATEVESLKLKLDDYIAHNVEAKSSEVNYKNALDIDNMLSSQEELKIAFLVFKAKLEEQHDELIMLQNKCNQLTNNLTEQKLKTEEFKNLSIYLKELKDSADVANEKKEKDVEGPTESLRMAFIKEQYQTKIQELKQQLSVSKRHNEEMLFKLQDALDEVESRKRSEASQLRRIQELEAEGELVISDRPDNDRLQAELECAVLSLECCKEEKEKLVALLQEHEGEKLKLADELSSMREQLAQKEENGSVSLQEIQGVIERTYEDEENPLVNDSKQLTVVNDQFRTQHLMSCMEQLDEELEKMKNDNSHLPLTSYDPSFQDLQRELAQLHQANEELASIYPNFVDFQGNGNALERVLALEIELAEALRTKKKSSIHFQSSFLKQHSDEEAVFKSFRDINELIKDMLEIKGKYANVENELKEMHDRYSQLSLQFAEVEGERQKLMMTLKSVRSSRNLLRMNRSSVAALGDQTL